MTTTVLPVATLRTSLRSALTALLLCSVATPALAHQAPAPSTTNPAPQEQTIQQTPGTLPQRPGSADVANPQTGSAVIDNAPLSAQDKTVQQNGLGEILVTATKRETNLQKTPIAISVANTQALADRHAMSLIDLGDGSIPSLRIATFEARQSALTIGIRGIVPFDANQTARDQGVGVYIDGIYLGRQQGLNASLLDIDRIEVLRGPQGTLFGRNTEGGALSIITKAPTGVFGLRGNVGFGNYGSYNGALHLDFPAFANLAIKLDGIMQHQDATTKNPLEGQYGWNYQNVVGGRAAARWTPSTNVTVDLAYDRTRNENTPFFSQLISYNPNGYNVGSYVNPTTGTLGTTLYFNGAQCNTRVNNPAVPGQKITVNPCIAPLAPLVQVSGGDRQETAAIGVPQQLSVDNTRGFSGNIKVWLSPDLELRSITGFRRVGVDQWDNSGGAERPPVYAPNGIFSRYSLSALRQKQWSQELQAVGSLGNVDYVVGGYYFHEKVSERAATPQTNQWNANGTAYTIRDAMTWQPANWSIARDSSATADSYAVFSQATWSPTGATGLHVTGGARYTHDKRKGALTTVNNAAVNYPFTYSDGRIDPMVTFAYDVSPTAHVYAKYSTGFRAGGANSRSATFASFGPESVRAYEIGAKMDLFNHLARLNFAAYKMDRKGTQIDFDFLDLATTLPNGQPNPNVGRHYEETRNAPGTSKISGFEADLTVRPTWNLQMSASYAYTHVKVPPTANPFNFFQPVAEVFTVFTPRHAASGAIDYELPAGLAGGKVRLHLDGNYAGRQYSFQSEDVKTDSSFIMNGRLSLADISVTNGSLVTLALWSRNLLNEEHIYRRSAQNSSPSIREDGSLNYGSVLGDYGNFNPPRTFGVEASFKIGAPRVVPVYVPPVIPLPGPATVTCADGTVVVSPGDCPAAVMAPPPPPPVKRGERGR